MPKINLTANVLFSGGVCKSAELKIPAYMTSM